MSGSGLKVLFIGGTGIISASSVRRAVELGMDVHVLNRGNNARRRVLPDGVTQLTGDVSDIQSVRTAIGDRHFDAVANFVSFTGDDAKRAIETFSGRTDHYVHISTASLYRKPVRQWPIVESNVIGNPLVSYSQDKLDAERLLAQAYDDGFPATIVRPSHTYDETNPPLPGDWTIIERLQRGAEIVVPGDGTSLWTLTHAADFALGFVGLLGNPRAIGEAFHITSDDVYTWDQIYTILAGALGVEANLVHVPSELISVGAPDWFWSELLIGDLSHSAVFDNTKIRRYVPGFLPQRTFHATAHELVRWRGENPDLTRADPEVEAIVDRLVEGYRASRDAFVALAPRPAS